jgi:hypothetical protein
MSSTAAISTEIRKKLEAKGELSTLPQSVQSGKRLETRYANMAPTGAICYSARRHYSLYPGASLLCKSILYIYSISIAANATLLFTAKI